MGNIPVTTALDRLRARAAKAKRIRQYGFWAAGAVGALALLVGLPYLVVWGPYLLDGHIKTRTIGDGLGSATLVTGLRTSLVACAAAIGAGIALVYTIRNYRLNRRGQVTDRFVKALERLDSDQIYVRIGAVLALEQIIQDAPEQATHAAQVLGHFIRDRAPARKVAGAEAARRLSVPFTTREEEAQTTLPDRPAADVQAALTALTRRGSRIHVGPREGLVLSGLHLSGANLFAADLTNANLGGSNLTNASLFAADLTNAILVHADLTGAKLGRSNLTNANLVQADLTNANLVQADLSTTRNLTGEQIRTAQTDVGTHLPPGVDTAMRPPAS